MDCRKAQEEILESLAGGDVVPVEIDAHVAACPDCAAFAAKQTALDIRLSVALKPPELSPAFRSVLRKRIRRETKRLWPEWLPDLVHFASCGLATLLCAFLLPFAATTILSIGAAVTIVAYLLMTAVRISFEGDRGFRSVVTPPSIAGASCP